MPIFDAASPKYNQQLYIWSKHFVPNINFIRQNVLKISHPQENVIHRQMNRRAGTKQYAPNNFFEVGEIKRKDMYTWHIHPPPAYRLKVHVCQKQTQGLGKKLVIY